MINDWLSTVLSDEKAMLLPWRQTALDQFIEQGFPTRKDEAWKYTDVSEIAAQQFTMSKPSLTDVKVKPVLSDAIFIVFIDGVFSAKHSQISEQQGLTIKPISELAQDAAWTKRFLLETHSPFFDLNSALFESGLYIQIADHATIEKPLHILHLQTQSSNKSMNTVRHYIDAGKCSQVAVFEEYLGQEAVVYFNNTSTQINAGASSFVTHYRLQNENTMAYHIGYVHIDQAKDSRVDTYHINLGAKLARHDLHYDFSEPGAAATLVGLYQADDQQHLDTHTQVNHRVPHCESDQQYRGVLSGESHAVYNGRILVAHQAQKTAAYLNNRNLLLSPKAQIDTKPELEIYADDVKCSHGATVGYLDPEALFYLRSRGIDVDSAKKILLQAFLKELLALLPHKSIRDYIKSVVHHAS